MEGFEYVLTPHVFTSKGLCFGTTIPREVMALQGAAMSPFMRVYTLESNSQVGPGSYSPRKPDPHFANYAFHSKAYRFTPLIPDDIKKKFTHNEFYDVIDIGKKKIRKEKKPFGSGVPILNGAKIFCNNPGAGTYNVRRDKKTFYKHSFGGRIEPIFPVHLICKPQHLDRCSLCDVSPQADYFKNLKDEKCLCLKCMVLEIDRAKYQSKTKVQKIKRLDELENDYKLTRYCGFYHQHENTTAKVRLLDPREVRLKLKREHYLSQFDIK